MRTTKTFLAMTVVLLLVFLVGACAQATQAPPTSESQTGGGQVSATSTQPSGGQEGPVEIVYQRYAEGSDVELQFVEEFNASHPDIHVTVDTVPATDAYQKVLLTTEAGNPPDVFMDHWTVAAATTGLAMDITPYVEAEGADWYKNISENGWVFHDFKGRHYAMPWRVSPTVLFINNVLLKKAGLDLPPDDWTWDDFLAYAKAMTHPENDEYGFCLVGSADNTTTTLQFGAFLFEAGGRHIGDDGLSALDQQPTYDALNFLNKMMYEDKVVSPGTASSSTNTCTDLLAANKVGMWTNASLWRGILRNNYPDIDISVVPAPTGQRAGVWIGGTGLAISPGSEHPDAAWEFIKWQLSDENMRRWADALRFMPPNLSLWENPDFIADDPERAIVANIMNTQKMYPLDGYPDGDKLNGILRNYIQAVYIKDMTPEEAMAAATSEWNAILEPYQDLNWWDSWSN